MGDLGALQSEPRREQIERVILLLKISAAAFVQVRDVTGDGVGGMGMGMGGGGLVDKGWRDGLLRACGGLRAQQVNGCGPERRNTGFTLHSEARRGRQIRTKGHPQLPRFGSLHIQ